MLEQSCSYLVWPIMLQVCSYFLAGHCAYGKQCRFAHLLPDGTSAEADPSQRPSPAEPAQPVSRHAAGPSGADACQPHHRRGAADAAWYEGGQDAGVRLPDSLMEEPAAAAADEAAEEEQEQGAEGWQQGWQQGYYNSECHFVYYEYGADEENTDYYAGEGQLQDCAEGEPEQSAEDDGSEDAVEEAVRLSYLSWIDEQGAQARWAFTLRRLPCVWSLQQAHS